MIRVDFGPISETVYIIWISNDSLDTPSFTLLSNKGQSEIIKKSLTFQWFCLIYLYKQFLRLDQKWPLYPLL
jgi:hypothetical protein